MFGIRDKATELPRLPAHARRLPGVTPTASP